MSAPETDEERRAREYRAMKRRQSSAKKAAEARLRPPEAAANLVKEHWEPVIQALREARE